jgi:Kdo2-lipid IVA lauroyltransferase/acyltransferase
MHHNTRPGIRRQKQSNGAMHGRLIKSALTLCAWLPLPVLHGLGVCFGWAFLLIPGRPKIIAQTNISLCWPELSTQQQRRLVRSSLTETGKTLFETGALWLRPGEHTLRLIKQVNGHELVEQAVANGKGVILATPHLGAWEAAGLYCAANFNITCLYRTPRKPGLEEMVNTARSRLGGQYIAATTQGIRTLYKTLQQGHAIAMLPDQEPQVGAGTFAPFFGVSAYSMVLLARMAAKSGAPVIFACCERLPWGSGYQLYFRSAPDITNPANISAAIDATNKAVEDCVRECPAQYQWSYRRFRTRPAGEAPFY